MRKLFAIILASILFCTGSALAEDLGVQVIGGSDTVSIPVSLDDIQLGVTYTIDGYAKLIPQSFAFVDYFAQFNDDADYHDNSTADKRDYVYFDEDALKGHYVRYHRQASWKDSGASAEFAWLQLDIVNLQKKDVKLMEEATVKAIYADEYEYAGWMRQANYDYNTQVYRYNATTTGAPFAVISPKNEEAVGMMYTGVFIVGATLPNAVVEDKASPLSIVLTLGGNEITYNIRK